MLLFISVSITAQTKKTQNKVVQQYDLKKLKRLEQKFSEKARKEKEEAVAKAKQEGWAIQGEENGKFFELMRLTPDGKPVYYQTDNYYAAKTIRTDKLYSGGSLGLNIQGQNMIVGVWDGGAVRATHNYLTGRVIQKDGAVFSGPTDGNRHATHVTGTMIANGYLYHRGMAFEATAWAHDWNNDESEMAARAAEGLLVSNHSYGMRSFDWYGNRLIDLYWFGKYSYEAKDWDEIMYNAPYYLAVDAAGNDRYWSSHGPNKGGYDMLTGNSTGKNGITVAAVYRVTNYTAPSSVTMSSFSNWGPTDDGRIKPDISAQGVDVTSCTSDSNSSTASYDGTSMAAPGVTGSLILLQQYYHQKFGNYMKAATLKGLALHTADEAGAYTGPDYAYGWGLMNTAKAAEAIQGNGLQSLIMEITLHEGETYSFDVDADGINSLMASIAWTDPAGDVISGSPSTMLDNPTPVLVNDLDIRITKNGNTYYPWKLDPAHPSNPATTGDNIVDNFEKIQIDNASGTYTVEISHKNNLRYGKQDVSIIITGIHNSFAINALDGEHKSVCSDTQTSVNYSLSYIQEAGLTGVTTFSIDGLPAGATATFTPDNMSADGTFDLEISGLDAVTEGVYNMQVVGTNGNNQEIKNIQLHVLKQNFTPQSLIAPENGAVDRRRPFKLEWEEHPNAEQYVLQLSYNDSFSNIFLDETVNTTSYTIKEGTYGISNGHTYYWRVKPINQCAEGDFSDIWHFKTLEINCSTQFESTPVAIPSSANSSPIESVINYPHDYEISHIRTYVDISHSRISDLQIKLISPSGTEVILNQSGTCQGNYQDIQVNYDDNSPNTIDCYDTSPAIRDDVVPYESLSTFLWENALGDWTLSVSDPVNGEGGQINMWALEICEENYEDPSNNAVDDDQSIDLFKVWPNPSNGQINISLSAGKIIQVRLMDISGREVFSRTYNNQNETFTKNLILGHLKKGIYLLQVSSNDKQAVKRIIIE